MTIGIFELFELELTTLLTCVLIAFLGGVVRGFTGFAGSLFMLPCYTLLLGPIPGMNIIILSGLVGVTYNKKGCKIFSKKDHSFLQFGTMYWSLHWAKLSFSK